MSFSFYIMMPVWGEKHINHLLDYGLATLMSPGNLPGLPNAKESTFVFLTTEADAERIKKTKLYAELATLMHVEWMFRDFRTGTHTENYDQMNDALLAGAQVALGKGFCSFLAPDGLYSDGMMTWFYHLAETGKKLVVGCGPMAIEETVVSLLEERGLERDSPLTLPPRELVGMLNDNQHPDVLNHAWDNDHYPEVPYMTVWPLPSGNGHLYRYVSLHPLLVDLRDVREIAPFGAIDHDYARAQRYPFRDIYVECDSDKFLILGLKPKDDHRSKTSRKVNVQKKVWLPHALFNPSNCAYSRFNFFNGFLAHTKDLTEQDLQFEKDNLAELNAMIGSFSYNRFYLGPMPFRQKLYHLARSIIMSVLNFNFYSIVRNINELISSVVPKPVRRGMVDVGRGFVKALPKFLRDPVGRFLFKILGY